MSYTHRNSAGQPGTNRTTQAEISSEMWRSFPVQVMQSDCQTSAGCSYQQSFALSYHLRKDTRLYAEVFGQNTPQSNTPPGTYVFSGFYHQFNDAFGIDGGLRFGVSDNSARIGTTIGLVFGKRLHVKVRHITRARLRALEQFFSHLILKGVPPCGYVMGCLVNDVTDSAKSRHTVGSKGEVRLFTHIEGRE